MGYVLQMMVALFFSTGGTSVRLIRPYFSPSMITFMRFFVGVGWLLLLKAILRKPFRADFRSALRARWKWLIFGAVSKFLSYICENTALSIGVSYGNILVQPVQMILLTVLGVVALHEAMSRRKWIGVALCAGGILLISWNGLSLDAFLGGNLTLSLLYVAAGIFAGLFIFAQKKVAADFDILDSNLFMFAAAAALSFLVPVAQGNILPASAPNLPCVLAVLWFGFVTGIGFYLNAKSVALIPFQMVAVLQSTMVFFSLAWGILLFHETVTGWIIGGTLMFVLGILLMQLRPAHKA